TAVLALAGFAVFLAPAGPSETGRIAGLLRDAAFTRPLVLSTLFATVLALSLMNQFQRELDPIRAAILFALEPVWTTLIAIFAGFGRPGLWLCLGGGALIAGNLIAEWGVAADAER